MMEDPLTVSGHARRLTSLLVLALIVSFTGLTFLSSASAVRGRGASQFMAGVPQATAAMRRPSVASVTPGHGRITGGTRITIIGGGFRHGARVLIGSRWAKHVVVKSRSRLKATTPPGVFGRDSVRVKTSSGMSRRHKAAHFNYRYPAKVRQALYKPAAGTVPAAGVSWVMGGAGVKNPRGGKVRPWIVGLLPGTAAPRVGDQYFVAPGTRAFPSGLAGKVTAIADQADGGVAVTVSPTPLGKTLSAAHVSFAGPLGSALGPIPSTSHVRRPKLGASKGVDFGVVGPSAFLCKNQQGQKVSFSGEVGVRLENMHAGYQVDAGSAVRRPYISVWVSGDSVLYGKVTVSAKITCELSKAFETANTRTFPIGTTGATLSLGPAASFSISGSGTFSFEQRTSRLVGFETKANGDVHPLNASGEVDRKVTASGTVALNLSGGLSVKAGFLSVVGFEGKIALSLTGSAHASGPPPKVCVDVSLQLITSIGPFLDVWVWRWHAPSLKLTEDLARSHTCTAPEDPVAQTSSPMIATWRLPDATNGTPYDAALTTTDNRPGSWSLANGRLPAGLTLDQNSGHISGTPNAQVRDYSLDVRFTDASGRSTVAIVRLYVKALVLAPGDIQASLTWSSAADLDLHVTDPSGEEVWYHNPGPVASGGYLDVDANAACREALVNPAENIVWPSGSAPSGTYQVRVAVYDPCGAADLSWQLRVRVRDQVVLDTTGTGDSAVYNVSVGAAKVTVTRHPAARVAVHAKK
jgi:hypothetical protein